LGFLEGMCFVFERFFFLLLRQGIQVPYTGFLYPPGIILNNTPGRDLPQSLHKQAFVNAGAILLAAIWSVFVIIVRKNQFY
jgi:hypothetical protein